jgi:pyruvate dehydrogenase E2 component (dihydrolipoamide acetyltransferase)
MSEPITMPALSDTMNVGHLVRWVKKIGDSIKKGETIAEVETDKALMEVEAFHDGYLVGPLAPEDSDMPVGQIIGYIADQPGENPPGLVQAIPAVSKAAPPEAVRAAGVPAEGDAAAAGKGAPAPAAKPAAAPTKTTDGPTTPQFSAQSGEGKGTKPAPGPQSASAQPAEGARSASLAAQSSSPPLVGAESSAPKAPADEAGQTSHPGPVASSPLARRLAKDAGVDLSRIRGSGPHGRIVEADVEAAKLGMGAMTPAGAEGAAPAIHGMSDQQIRALYAEGSYEFVPHDSMRRIIAQRMVQSNLTIPDFFLAVDCDIGKLLAAHEESNRTAPQDKDGKPLWKLSVDDFVIKALALALQRVPEANATWTEGGMLKHRHSDVGVAVSIKGGLITPVVRSAETKSLSVIANEMKDLAARARARQLKPEEYRGGVSTVSNLGMYGIKDFTAVINPPQATILAVGAGEERPVARSGKIEIATIMTVTLSCDHRVVDGALGAQLLSAFKELIEQPVMLAA